MASLKSSLSLLPGALAAAVGLTPAIVYSQTISEVVAVAPKIVYPRELDVNANRIDDMLDNQLASATSASAAKPVRVQLIFNGPITQAQIDRFVSLGGQISYIYKATSYGFNGTVPLGSVMQARNVMGANLVMVCGDRLAFPTMDEASRTGRVRSIWAAGASSTGYTGSPTTTIAVLDTGLDGTHTDLSGRQAWWHDYTASAMASPVDYGGHGSHVAGIALGTGAASGINPTSLKVSFGYNLTGLGSGYGYFSGIHVPTGAASAAMTAAWRGGGSTTLYWASSADNGGGLGAVSYASGTSPLTLNANYTAASGTRYGAFLGQSSTSSITFAAVYGTIGFKGLGDGFSPLSGVAPGAKWAGCKVFQNDSGSCYWSDVGAAIDDMVARRASLNVKVMNLSLGGDLYAPIRTQINNAVANGIVVAVAMGNNGPGPSVGDPQSAAKAITIAAANDINQLTSYSSSWSGTPDSSQDYKPDLMAPGGSDAYSDIMSVDSNSSDADNSSFPDQQANDYTGMHGTSMASPFVAGCAALVIQALEDHGTAWDFTSDHSPLLVKMLLCATSTESNQNREGGSFNPILGRATTPKDNYEGYGMINPDAAVEAVSQPYTWGNPLTRTTTGSVFDQRAWARNVSLNNGARYQISLTCPATGDFDLYLYSATPGTNGNPVILSSSCKAGLGQSESITYDATSDQSAYLVVKRVSGSGQWSLSSTATGGTTYTIRSLAANPSTVMGGSPAPVTGTVTISAAAPAAGLTVNLASDNPAVTVPTGVVIASGQTTGTFSITTSGVSAATTATITATLGSSTATTSVSVVPPSVASLTLSGATIEGGIAGSGTVVLPSTAPTGGLVVTLASSKTNLATVPPTVTVAAGSASATFPITTYKVTASAATVITASIGSTTAQTASLTVKPAAKLTSLAVSPNPIDAGATATGTVTIDSPAVSGGCLVTLKNSTATYYTAPTSVTVPEGATSATFSVTASQDTITGTAGYITASHTGSANVNFVVQTNGRRLKSLTATPNPVVGGLNCTGTVTISVPAPTGGYVVNLTSSKSVLIPPSSVTVPEGSTTASFTIGTTPQSAGDVAYITASHAGSANAQVVIKATCPQLVSLTASPAAIPIGGTSVGTVTIGNPAGKGGYLVQFVASSPTLVGVPTTVTIPEGATSTTFTIRSYAKGTGGIGYVTAMHTGSTNSIVVLTSVR